MQEAHLKTATHTCCTCANTYTFVYHHLLGLISKMIVWKTRKCFGIFDLKDLSVIKIVAVDQQSH